jgi:hypothetical protein
MWLIDWLAEMRIAEAMDRGELRDLPGAGRPLELETDPLVPEELRVAHRLLKNAGYLPPELELLRELRDAEELLAMAAEPASRREGHRRLAVLNQRLSLSRGERMDVAAELRYQGRLLERLEQGPPLSAETPAQGEEC